MDDCNLWLNVLESAELKLLLVVVDVVKGTLRLNEFVVFHLGIGVPNFELVVNGRMSSFVVFDDSVLFLDLLLGSFTVLIQDYALDWSLRSVCSPVSEVPVRQVHALLGQSSQPKGDPGVVGFSELIVVFRGHHATHNGELV